MRRAFTLVELLVVLLVLVVLVSLALVGLAKSRASARLTVCSIHMKQCGLAVQMYLDAARVLPFCGENSGWGEVGGPVDDLPRESYTCPDLRALNPVFVFIYRPGRMMQEYGALGLPDPSHLLPVTRHYEMVPREWLFIEYQRVHAGKRSSAVRMDGSWELGREDIDAPPLAR